MALSTERVSFWRRSRFNCAPRSRFTSRGFSYSTIKALVVGGIDAPEQLLFADEADLLSISGLDEKAFEEIARYRAQFAGTQRKQTWRTLNVALGAPRGSRARDTGGPPPNHLNFRSGYLARRYGDDAGVR
jgi:hypothetical protein